MPLQDLSVAKYRSISKVRGFSFLEIIILMTIIFIIGVTSAWFSMQFFFQQQTVLAAQIVSTSLSRANLYAQSGKVYSDWGVAVRDKQVIVFAGSSYESRNSVFDESAILPGGILITGLDEIIFARLTGETSQAMITISGKDQDIQYKVSSWGAVTKL
ncbi:MAG: hypothetical protein E6P95_03760 [Candidatus Moraniibacteriota bacterium]|nr:MAG: hypothetical protein E6P95_03760 [Candidatus Moranbacteria bacterium]